MNNNNNLKMLDLEFDKDFDKEEETAVCCKSTVEFRSFGGLPKFETFRQSVQGFHNFLNDFNWHIKIPATENVKISETESERTMKEVHQLLTLLAEKLKNETTTTPIVLSTTSAAIVSSSGNSTSDSTIYIILACIFAFLLILFVITGFLLYERKSSQKSDSNSNKRSLPEQIVTIEEPEYEYIRYNTDNPLPKIHFSSIFPSTSMRAPTAPQLESNIEAESDNSKNSKLSHKIQVASVYSDVIDADRVASDDFYSPDNDFYSQVDQDNENEDENDSQGNRNSDLYATM